MSNPASKRASSPGTESDTAGRWSKFGWPEAYLQPDRTKDCGFYSVAYIGHCFGLDVTAEDVKAWRAETNTHEDHYLLRAHGVPMRRPADDRLANRPYKQWWMGPDQREWVRGMLADNICLVHLLRIPTMHHSVVALEAHEDGVLLMDPIYGFVLEPWDWFLGPGPGTNNAHALWSAHPRTWSPWAADAASRAAKERTHRPVRKGSPSSSSARSCGCLLDPDTGQHHDRDGWRCSHHAEGGASR